MKKIIVVLLIIVFQAMFEKTAYAQTVDQSPKEVSSVSGKIASNVGAIQLAEGVWSIVVPTTKGKAVHVLILPANDTLMVAFKQKQSGFIAIVSDAVPIDDITIKSFKDKKEVMALLTECRKNGYFIAMNWEVKKDEDTVPPRAGWGTRQ